MGQRSGLGKFDCKVQLMGLFYCSSSRWFILSISQAPTVQRGNILDAVVKTGHLPSRKEYIVSVSSCHQQGV